MGTDPISLIISTFAQLYIHIMLVRFLLQISGADYYNPLSQSIVKITQPVLTPLQRLLPKVGRIDISPLITAFVLVGALYCVLLLIKGYALQEGLGIVLLSSVAYTINAILNIYFYAVIGSVIISWIAPGSYHPAPQLIMQLTEPLFKLFQKVIPPIGGLDLSPIFIFLAIQLIQSQLAQLIIRLY